MLSPCLAVIPLYQTFSRVFPGTKPLLTYVMRNYSHWHHEQNRADAAP